jgi:hypothetical protein
MKIAFYISCMFIGLVLAFSESSSMVPNFLGAISFFGSCVVLGSEINRRDI